MLTGCSSNESSANQLKTEKPEKKPTVEGESKDASMSPSPKIAESEHKNTPKAGIPIWQAAEAGAIKELNQNLNSGLNINAKDSNNMTPLHWASTAKIIAYILSKGADVNAKDNQGMTPLHHYVIKLNFTDSLKLIIDSGAKVNAKTLSGHTALHYATSNDKYQLMQYLIKSGADVNTQSNSGVSPLHSACLSDDIRIMKALIVAGAAVNIQTKSGAKVFVEGTPLDWAIKRNIKNKIQYLRDNEAKTIEELNTESK